MLIRITRPWLLRWFGWKDPLPSYVIAHWRLWKQWRTLARIGK